MPPGFQRNQLKPRYDVPAIVEDSWHSYSEASTKKFVERCLSSQVIEPSRVLNAGCSSSSINVGSYNEVCLDLFHKPLVGRAGSVCGTVTRLPFGDSVFGCVVCVGEVLGYCDPAAAIDEFARVLAPSGALICDFSSTLSWRRRFTPSFRRSADLIIDQYNGAPERLWIYNPEYIRGLLKQSGFSIEAETGTHFWSALARRLSFSSEVAASIEQKLADMWKPQAWCDLITIFAVREKAGAE